jgi:uncharacterized membrane protein YqiK
MNPADDEINIFLPLAFGMLILLLVIVFGLVFWLLTKAKVIEIKNRSNLFKVVSGAVFSIIGVFFVWGIIKLAEFIFRV